MLEENTLKEIGILLIDLITKIYNEERVVPIVGKFKDLMIEEDEHENNVWIDGPEPEWVPLSDDNFPFVAFLLACGLSLWYCLVLISIFSLFNR